MPLELHVSEPLRSRLSPSGGHGLVLQPSPSGDEWPAVLATLRKVFERSRRAVQEGIPIVYVVDNQDLLGRRGPGRAMVATGVLSAARTLALETAKAGLAVNVVGLDSDTPPETAARWIRAALEGGPTGELIRLGPGHIGKALP